MSQVKENDTVNIFKVYKTPLKEEFKSVVMVKDSLLGSFLTGGIQKIQTKRTTLNDTIIIEYFITSKAVRKINEDQKKDIIVKVKKAVGSKCNRCWR